MRRLSVAAAALGLLLSEPAAAAKLKFQPSDFRILGGIDNGEQQVSYNATPEDLRHRTIRFQTALAPGSILVKTGLRRLYYILPDGEAVEYHVGVGREGFTWSGTNTVSRKAEWPEWRPPPEMIEREAARGRTIPDYMEGGPDNPLGARAIYIGDTQYRIHGTTQPWSIGQASSSGCIRMMNDQVMDLYERVQIGATVVVEN